MALSKREKNNRAGKQNSGSPKKAPFWFYLVLILFPILFLLLLEGGLRLFDYGYDLSQWKKVDTNKQIINPNIARRYFYTTKNIPEPVPTPFEIEKGENTYRVFVIGGSSAAGFPYSPNGSFDKYIRKRLELLYPNFRIEVINSAMTATNSYTMRDLINGILDQQPDLILMYGGHNEYYGALGVGSMESLGNSPTLINFMLSLNKFKTIQLLRNSIAKLVGLFSAQEATSGTLMARMAADQKIFYGSDVHRAGIKQFETNVDGLLSAIKNKGVKCIVGKLAANLKDQSPFISEATAEFPSADSIYQMGRKFLREGNTEEAHRLFIKAKDLDALKFRAPSEINEILDSLARKYDFPIVDIESQFDKISPDSIVGNNLMTDHLHPTLEGYQLMGRSFFAKMISEEYLPDSKSNSFSITSQDSIVKANYNFTELDSTIARYRIIILKSDWPYVSNKLSASSVLRLFNPQNYSDSMAIKVINSEIPWEKAHRLVADYYYSANNIPKYLEEMEAVIDRFPFIGDYYEIVSQNLIAKQKYDLALKYLNQHLAIESTPFNNKWIGIISLSKNEIAKSIKYLKNSFALNPRDPQLLYNLAGAYSINKDFVKANEAITMCLAINPNYRGAKELHTQIKRAL